MLCSQLGLQVQVGHDVKSVKNDVSAVKEGMLLYKVRHKGQTVLCPQQISYERL